MTLPGQTSRPPSIDVALRASLAERLRATRGGANPPDALLDVRRVRVSLGDGADPVLVPRPADWSAVREAERRAGRGPPYWAVLWPSGLMLARAVAASPPAPGARVLELGCGLAVPSVAAGRAGAEVVALDRSTDAAVFAAHTLTLNDVDGEVLGADWREVGERLAERPFDLVLAADVLYLRGNVSSLIGLLPRVTAPGGEAWIADPGRAGEAELLRAARRLWHVESHTVRRPDGVTVHRLRRRR